MAIYYGGKKVDIINSPNIAGNQLKFEKQSNGTCKLKITNLNDISKISFANASVKYIKQVAEEVSINNYTSTQLYDIYGWRIGDKRIINLTDGQIVRVRIIGVNHDDKSDGSGKAGLTLELDMCLKTKYNHKTQPDYLNNTVYYLLPIEWQEIIKTVNKETVQRPSAGVFTLGTEQRKLFLLSENELVGDNSEIKGINGIREGQQYEFYINTTNNDWIKKCSNDSGFISTTTTYGLRTHTTDSTVSTATERYLYMSTTGVISVPNAFQALLSYIGVTFAFCI